MRKKHNKRIRVKIKSESWQTIYMDLMTIIMVFFIILWSLHQGKDEGVSDTVGDVTARMINLPGDILFESGKTELTNEGKGIIKELFGGSQGEGGLSFETSPLVKRMLMINGHTDSDGKKMSNLLLGFNRAFSAYADIKRYNKDLADHVVICTHADNSPEQEIPEFSGKLTPPQRQALKAAKKKNRRITIEDRIVNKFKAE